MRVVQQATALNLPFTDTGAEPAMDWQAQKEIALSRFERISSLHLSVFGRATAAAAYGCTTSLGIWSTGVCSRRGT
jgi:hypothetical protein